MYQNRRIGEILAENGKITPEQLEEALDVQIHTNRRLGEILVSQGLVSVDDLDEAQAFQFEVPYEPLNAPLLRDVLDLVPAQMAQVYHLLPVAVEGHVLHVAMVNPNDLDAIDWLQVSTKKQIAPRFTPVKKLERALAFYYGISPEKEEVTATVSPEDALNEKVSLEDAKRASEEPPVVSLINSLLADAIRQRASDVHFEPSYTGFEIRFRVDGILRPIKTLPKAMQAASLSRLKIMSELDISERRLPQDGRMSVTVNHQKVDLRVSTLPTRHGERIVLRILDKERSILKLSQLGFTEHNYNTFASMIQHPHGLVLVTGPTGSGKTTTLYAALMELKSDARNLMTTEDPVEFELDGIGQSQVHERIGLTFAAQLRALLRQDPDIILVGEIRDQQTAEIACRAAMTGHLVLSTLHTNDAPSAVPRLIDMGVEPFLLNSALLGVVAQRLVRTLCPECKKEKEINAADRKFYELPKDVTVYEAVGCDFCSGYGYKGRMSIHEVMEINEEIQLMIATRAPASQIRVEAIGNGMVPLQKDALDKVIRGLTSLEEISTYYVAEKAMRMELAS